MKNLYIILSLALSAFFLYLFKHIGGTQETLTGGLPIDTTSVSFGVILNVTMTLVYCAFGSRISKSKLSIRWFYLQLILNSCLLSEQILVFGLLISAALSIHINISRRDVYQSISPGHYFPVFSGFSVIAAMLIAVFCGNLLLIENYTLISSLRMHPEQISQFSTYLGALILVLLVGVFPFHFWVRPVFLAPTRYGLAAIMRLYIGFAFWCKFGFLLNKIFAEMPGLIIALLTANLIYSALVLFGERKLSGIAASLYQWHVSLFLLGGLLVSQQEKIYSLMDFFNTSICISCLMIVISMIRDRVGADRIDSASGLAISFPIFGLAFLFCVLSLIGFPGTIGFVSSEILLHCLSESYWPVAGCFVAALALNGYSCFRIFGDSFYGSPSLEYPLEFQPRMREKITLVCMVAIILLLGLKPDLIDLLVNYF